MTGYDMKKKRVLEINKRYVPYIGGVERVVQQIAEGLSEELDMTVLACSTGRHREEYTEAGVHVIKVPSIGTWGKSLPIPIGLIKEVRRQAKKQDVMHLHMPFPFGDIACLCSGFKGKMVLWWHSDVVRQKRMMHLYKPVMKRMLKRADVIVVANEGLIEGSDYLKEYREKCVIIPFGVEKQIEEAADRYIESQPDEEQKQGKRIRFLFVGRLVYYKGCKVLLDAFRQVPDAELVLVGTGTLEEELRRMVADYGLEGRVTFLGKVSEEELCEQYKACDVFILPSVVKSEAFGLVQIEAMAFGKPVINTALPSGVPYVSIDGETGLTVPVENSQVLAEAMQWLAEHEEERKEMGKRARKRVEEKYRFQRMIQDMKTVYEE